MKEGKGKVRDGRRKGREEAETGSRVQEEGVRRGWREVIGRGEKRKVGDPKGRKGRRKGGWGEVREEEREEGEGEGRESER